MSSAGVYLPSDQLPHLSGATQSIPKATRYETEAYLTELLLFTATPTYIYGPQNYNELSWFLTELCAIAYPDSWQWFTHYQLGHVKDLAAAMLYFRFFPGNRTDLQCVR